MPEFLKLVAYQEALETMLRITVPKSENEVVPVQNALGRITSEVITAVESAPAFDRSAVDGYAVRARDSYGASESMPMFFKLAGEVLMGKKPTFSLRDGNAGKIHTGGMLPESADAVVMLENTAQINASEIEVYRPVAVNENVILKGEDIEAGATILPRGTKLDGLALSGCLAQGIDRVQVFKQIRVGVISNGDELVQPERKLEPAQVRDINSSILEFMLSQEQFSVKKYGIVPDQIDVLRDVVRKADRECDAVIITAGSSVSARDNTAVVIAEMGSPGVLVHGINIKPGKPTILAYCEGKPFIGLPGNPVSAFVVAKLILLPILFRLQGYTNMPAQAVEKARLTTNIASQAGRADFIPVQLTQRNSELYAAPIFFKSNLIFSLVKADGLACIPEDVTGLNVDQEVKIMRLK